MYVQCARFRLSWSLELSSTPYGVRSTLIPCLSIANSSYASLKIYFLIISTTPACDATKLFQDAVPTSLCGSVVEVDYETTFSPLCTIFRHYRRRCKRHPCYTSEEERYCPRVLGSLLRYIAESAVNQNVFGIRDTEKLQYDVSIDYDVLGEFDRTSPSVSLAISDGESNGARSLGPLHNYEYDHISRTGLGKLSSEIIILG